MNDGSMLLTDDALRTVWRVAYTGAGTPEGASIRLRPVAEPLTPCAAISDSAQAMTLEGLPSGKK